MFNSPFLDGVIAMLVLYLLFSQLTLSLVELPAGAFNWRGRYLHGRLADTLGPTVHRLFYGAAPVRELMLPPAQKNFLLRGRIPGWPAYISETRFAQTVIGVVSAQEPATEPPRPGIAQFEAGRQRLPEELPADKQFKSLLATHYRSALATASTAEGQSAALQKNLETWFHEYGERMSGWYKRDTRKYSLLAGLLVAVLADVDTGRLGRFIFDGKNAEARLKVVSAGLQLAQGPPPTVIVYNPTSSVPAPPAAQPPPTPEATALLAAARREFQRTLDAVPAAGLPLGWLRFLNTDTVRTDTTTRRDPVTGRRRYAQLPPTYAWAPTADDYRMPPYAQRWRLDPATGQVSHPPGWSWLPTVGGWLLTGLALMLGAPFWFDLLGRFVNIRNIGIKPAPKS